MKVEIRPAMLAIALLSAVPALAGGGGETSEPSLFQLDPGVGLWAILTFVILLILLKIFAWGPIINSIDGRDKTLRDSFEAAEQARNESKKIAEEQKEILSKSREEASRIITEAKRSSDDYRKKQESGAQEEKARIVSSAQDEILAMKDEAIAEIKSVTVDLAIGAAEKLLEQNLDRKSSQKLVENYIEKMDV